MNTNAAPGHPNDPEEVRRQLAHDAASLTERERRELRQLVDTALGKLAAPALEPPEPGGSTDLMEPEESEELLRRIDEVARDTPKAEQVRKLIQKTDAAARAAPSNPVHLPTPNRPPGP